MNDRSSNLTVRIKLVDLNHIGFTSKSPSRRSSSEQVSALVGSTAERTSRPLASGKRSTSNSEYATGEICLLSGGIIPSCDFENHIEECSICANRVELQLDFMETLEVAIYQRQADPKTGGVRGAMLISTPELNFAVCGEIEL